MRSSVADRRGPAAGEWPSARHPVTASSPAAVGGDRLDRMAARLVRVLAARPGYDALAPVAIADLFHVLLSPRATVTELELRNEEEYDLLLMRLLSGERGYVIADVAVQQALAVALANPDGDPAEYRAHARAVVALAPHAVQMLEPARVCRCCSGRLPTTTTARFCPTCGEDLAVQRCPACSTVCEIGWRYCVSCGRGL